jgi:dGTPase
LGSSKKAKKKSPDPRYERFYPDSPPDNRTNGQRDRDRILYTSAFRRLAGVTQVISAHEGHVFHNRLTHSLEVAQLARRAAEKLLREQPRVARSVGGIDPDIAEAAALAHDLGHPPFGHIAEQELDRLLVQDDIKDGFNGNAQSFRIVTRLALRRSFHPGLNLTRATLNGVLKYPWLRCAGGEESEKWGSYESDRQVFEWARQGHPGKIRSAEAELMDWADDVTYAVHDIEDFYRAGRIPIDRLKNDSGERKRFLDFAGSRYKGRELEWEPVRDGFSELVTSIPLSEPYSSSRDLRAALRSVTGVLIARYISAIELREPTRRNSCPLAFDPVLRAEVWMWKQLTWYYVIDKPSLATQQHGLRGVITCLYEIFRDAARSGNLNLFPAGFREALGGIDSDWETNCHRIVVDFIAGMSEREAIVMHHRLTGATPGSALDHVGA